MMKKIYRLIGALCLLNFTMAISAWAQPASPNPGPSVVISSVESGSTSLDSFNVTIVFSEAVTSLAVKDLDVSNAALANPIAVSDSVYSIDVYPNKGGVVEVSLPYGAALGANGNKSQASNVFSIDYTGMPASYCSSNGDASGSDWIKRFTIFDGANNSDPTLIDHLSSKDSTGYADYTEAVTAATLVAGNTYRLRIFAGRSENTRLEAYKVWVDYTRDGDFADAEELAYSRNLTDGDRVTGLFTVPAGATLGITRLRVQMKYNQVPFGYCETFSRGETEDYALELVGAGLHSARRTRHIAVPLQAFPNPARATATISHVFQQHTASELLVYDWQGRLAYSERVGTGQHIALALSTATWEPGIYLLVLQGNNGEIARTKLLVNH